MAMKEADSYDPRNQMDSAPAWWNLVCSGVSEALVKAIKLAYHSGPCWPNPEDWFRALTLVGAPEQVRVVILGQDPYHGPQQANGLAFSVARGLAIPPSLRNIYKELSRDGLGVPPVHGDLSSWAEQGVLLLNHSLSVAQGNPASHAKFGWDAVTQSILTGLNIRPVVFLLWGKHAQSQASFLQALHPDHVILQAPHPSPLSAHRGFIGCGHFSRVNRWLSERGEAEVQWLNGPW